MSRLLRATIVVGGLLFALVLLVGGHDWCGARQPRPAQVRSRAWAEGPLSAGAASAPLEMPMPAVVAGYGIPRETVRRASAPLEARAVVLQAGQVRVGLLSLDLLVGDSDLDSAIRAATAGLGLTDLWVTVTHTHSGPGGYASNWVAQVAGTGLLRAGARDAVVAASSQALTGAAEALEPVSLRLGESSVPELIGARVPPPEVDARVSRLVLEGARGPLAQLIVLACHPTLVPRPPPGLDPDWPGRLAEQEWARGNGLTLVLQGAVGNLSPKLHDPEPERLARFVAAVGAAVDAIPLAPVAPGLGVARAVVALPGPDASRLVPRVVRPLADNLLCACSPTETEVAVLRVGPLVLLGVPAEPTAGAGRVLERAAAAHRVVSLVDGYLGYLETPEHVGAGEGEADRQFFGPGFLELLAQGARTARSALP